MNVLEVQGLTKRYPAFTLNGVSFDVPQGAVMGVYRPQRRRQEHHAEVHSGYGTPGRGCGQGIRHGLRGE